MSNTRGAIRVSKFVRARARFSLASNLTTGAEGGRSSPAVVKLVKREARDSVAWNHNTVYGNVDTFRFRCLLVCSRYSAIPRAELPRDERENRPACIRLREAKNKSPVANCRERKSAGGHESATNRKIKQLTLRQASRLLAVDFIILVLKAVSKRIARDIYSSIFFRA